MAIEDHPRFGILQTLVESLILKVRNKQADYFVEKGKFFQGLSIPATGQPSGDVGVAVNYGLRPDDQADSWNSFDAANWNATTRLPAKVRIDVYQSPAGWGWILKIELWKAGLGPDRYGTDGDHWVFKHNEGPQTMQGVWDEWFIETEEFPVE